MKYLKKNDPIWGQKGKRITDSDYELLSENDKNKFLDFIEPKFKFNNFDIIIEQHPELTNNNINPI